MKTAKSEGWTRIYGGAGAAFRTSFVRDTYLDLKPRAAGVAATSESSTLAIAIGVAAALVVVVLVLARRRRRFAKQE